MDYDNLIEDNGIYLYKDNSFNTIFITLIFKRLSGNKNDAIYILLADYLLKANKIYKKVEDIREKKNEFYSMDINLYNCYYGNTPLLYSTIDLISPQVVKDNYLDEAYDFINTMLLKPDFTREDLLKETKECYLSKIKQILSEAENYAERKYKQETYKGGEESFIFSNDYKYLEKVLNSITMKDLEIAYLNSIKSKFFKGFIFGNMTDEEFNSFRDRLPFENSKCENIDCVATPIFNKEKIEIPNKNSKDSIVYITYSLDSMDKALYNVLFDILNVSSVYCSSILREKYNLVYVSYVVVGYSRKTLIFKAQVDKKNIDKLINATDEIINDLKDRDKLKELLVKTRESIKNENYILSENKLCMIDTINDYVTGIFDKFNETEFADNIDKLTEDDLLEKTKTLKRRNIFIYRGDDCE